MKKWKKLLLIAANALCLLCLLVGALILSALRGTLVSQQAAERWRGENETRFAQVSVFTPTDSALDENTIFSFRAGLDTKLTEAGVLAPETGRLWTDAYCAIGSASVSCPRGSAQAKTVAVGGDFFRFHPLKLFAGQYISGDDLMKDLVVVNEMLAWKLYGGTSLAGMTVNVNGRECIIAGVVDVEDDFATAHAFDDETPLLFMAYELYASMQAQKPGITEYEIVMPNPLTDFARQHVAENLGGGAGVLTVENTGRFSGAKLRKTLTQFGERAMRTTPVELPYWENAALYLESCMALVWALMLPFYILPGITAVWLLVKLIRLGKRGAKQGVSRAGEAFERQRERRWAKKQAGKHVAARSTPVVAAAERTQPSAPEPEADEDVERVIREILSEKKN